MLYYTTFPTPFRTISIVGDEQGVTELHILTEENNQFEVDQAWRRNDEFFNDVKTQILEYFEGKRQKFDMPLNPQGTEFQKTVWRALTDIPYGEVRSYKDIATAIGNPNASRAIGMANAKNPIPLIVPCHRVIGSNGKLTGFALGLDTKEWLLRLEKAL